jgi:uncharacterized protein YbaP (TraB family)
MNGRRTTGRFHARFALLLSALVAIAGIPTRAASHNFIWKATSATGGTVFLAGSVHLLNADYYPLNPAFEESFASADLLVEELDMGEMLAPDSQMRMLSRGMLPAGQSIDKLVSPETLAAASKALGDLGMPFEPLKQFKPWMLAITLQSLAWQKAGFDADLGLDKHFYDLAQANGIRVQGLETLDFQLSRFDGMSHEVQDRMLAETLKELATTSETFTQMADAWKNGDTEGVEQQVLSDLKSEPQMYDRLLLQRNRTWLPKIEALFSRPRPAFVVVGAAHLIGTDGLLQMLRTKGYTVTQL